MTMRRLLAMLAAAALVGAQATGPVITRVELARLQAVLRGMDCRTTPCLQARGANPDTQGISCSPTSLPFGCTARGDVSRIVVERTPLGGTLGSELRQLSSLTMLVLTNTTLRGSLADVAALTVLREAILDQNDLQGTLPARWLDPAHGMIGLHLGFNPRVTGTIPSAIGLLSNTLRSLTLARTGLTGALPAEIWRLSRLSALTLIDLGLTGEIGDGIRQMSALQVLSTSGNRLTGDAKAPAHQMRACILGGSFLDDMLRQYSNASTNCFTAGTCPAGCFCGDAGSCAGTPAPATPAPPTVMPAAPTPAPTLEPTPAPTPIPPIVFMTVTAPSGVDTVPFVSENFTVGLGMSPAATVPVQQTPAPDTTTSGPDVAVILAIVFAVALVLVLAFIALFFARRYRRAVEERDAMALGVYEPGRAGDSLPRAPPYGDASYAGQIGDYSQRSQSSQYQKGIYQPLGDAGAGASDQQQYLGFSSVASASSAGDNYGELGLLRQSAANNQIKSVKPLPQSPAAQQQ